MSKDITPSTFDKKLGGIAQTFFNNSTGGAYDVKIPETREYRELEAAVKQLIASEVIGPSRYKSGMHSAIKTHSDAGAGYSIGQESMRKEQLEALGIERTRNKIRNFLEI